MDNKKIIIINLSKGRMGDANAQLLGALLVTKIYLAAMSRADVGPHEIDALPDFSLFVDEFQTFANDSFAEILSEARKYKLNLHIAHQYVEQMPEEVRAAVFGNVGTLITFRVGSTDAELFEKEFASVFLQQDIVNLGFAQIYLRLMIDGMGSKPFSARTLPPLAPPQENNIADVIAASRAQYSRPRAEVEEQVARLTNLGKEEHGSHKSNQNNPKARHPREAPRERNPLKDVSPRTRFEISSDSNGIAKQVWNDRAHNEIPQQVRDDKVRVAHNETLQQVREDKIKVAHNEIPKQVRDDSLKKQLDYVKKKMIDEEIEEIHEQDFISLKEIQNKPGQKEISKENKNALKDALLKVLQQNGTVHDSSSKQNPPRQKENTKKFTSNKDKPIKPGEIPEDKLRQILEVEQ